MRYRIDITHASVLPTALSISAQLDALGAAQRYPNPRSNHALLRADIAGALGDCRVAVELGREALRMGRGLPFIHRRVGSMNCRDYPPFQELEKPRG